MKHMIKLPAIVLGLMLLLTGMTQKVFAQDEDISLQTFYDELSPYGTWIQDPQYGYVWRPDVDQREFRPYYTNGRWVMTEYGNTWVSEYDWGWAPFHYGRWVTDRYNQWMWIPDTTWGPAWVNWRSGGGQYGWAPLGPSISIGFNVPSFWWVFVPQTRIYIDRFPRYRSYRNSRYINNTVIINNVYVHNRNTYYTGPRRDEIRRVTNRDVTVYNINRINRPGRNSISNNTVNIYNPRPARGADNRNAAPRAVGQRDAVARNDVRRDGAQPRNENMNRPANRNNDNRVSSERVTLDRNTRDRNTGSEQKALATARAQREQRDAVQRNQVQRSEGQNQQRDAQQRQQREVQLTQQRAAQNQERTAQNQQREAQQRQSRDQAQRQQLEAQQNQQRQAQNQRREAQNQQREAQQRQQREVQQRSQRQEMSTPQRTERVQAPQRSSETRSVGNSGAERSGSSRGSRAGGRG